MTHHAISMPSLISVVIMLHVVFCTGILAAPATPIPASAMASAPALSEPKLLTELDATRVRIGDPFHLRLTAEGSAPLRFIFPGDALDPAPAVILDRAMDIPSMPPDTLRETLVLTLALYDVGDFDIPAIAIEWESPDGRRGTLTSEPQFIRVEPILDESTTAPRNPRPAIDIAPRSIYIIRVIAGIALLAAAVTTLLLWLHRRRHQPRSEPGKPLPPPIPAHEQALARLAALRNSNFLAHGDLKTYFVELTQILKEYIGDRYAFLALEHTTGEIRHDLRRLAVDRAVQTEVTAILDLGDMVKFARFTPEDDTCRETLERVEKLVCQTMDPRQPLQMSADQKEVTE
ncbi:hypothetical protein JXA80_09565 [bacterium]|nr:hypothetical protein [candidate division CSSED10-310 bacterium]